LNSGIAEGASLPKDRNLLRGVGLYTYAPLLNDPLIRGFNRIFTNGQINKEIRAISLSIEYHFA
jgi:hypothetical protein